ncbi:LysR family transcriptional regulator [Massilia phosphatilytica]
METKWLETLHFTALETKNFSRSAQLRHVTQPAFARRIRSLENWLGTDLVDRTTFPHPRHPGRHARSTNRRWRCWARSTACATCCATTARPRGKTIDLAVPHTLSLTFVPKWLTALERDFDIRSPAVSSPSTCMTPCCNWWKAAATCCCATTIRASRCSSTPAATTCC